MENDIKSEAYQENQQCSHCPRGDVAASIDTSVDHAEGALEWLGLFRPGENCLEWSMGRKGLELFSNHPDYVEQQKKDALIDLDCVLEYYGIKHLLGKVNEPFLEVLREPETVSWDDSRVIVAKLKVLFWLKGGDRDAGGTCGVI